jgi:hypothetical protein
MEVAFFNVEGDLPLGYGAATVASMRPLKADNCVGNTHWLVEDGANDLEMSESCADRIGVPFVLASAVGLFDDRLVPFLIGKVTEFSVVARVFASVFV